jgi:hypothetical protein
VHPLIGRQVRIAIQMVARDAIPIVIDGCYDFVILTQHPTGHLLCDFRVVLDQRLSALSKLLRNLPNRCRTTIVFQGHQHDRLIDVRLAHPVLDEIKKVGEHGHGGYRARIL